MEALTAVSVAALTVYDMCKSMSHAIELGEIRLISKTGGRHQYESPHGNNIHHVDETIHICDSAEDCSARVETSNIH